MSNGNDWAYWLNACGATLEAVAAALGGLKWILVETSFGRSLDSKLGQSWRKLNETRETLVGFVAFGAFVVVWIWASSALGITSMFTTAGAVSCVIALALGGGWAALTGVSKVSTLLAILVPVFAVGTILQAAAAWISR